MLPCKTLITLTPTPIPYDNKEKEREREKNRQEGDEATDGEIGGGETDRKKKSSF